MKYFFYIIRLFYISVIQNTTNCIRKTSNSLQRTISSKKDRKNGYCHLQVIKYFTLITVLPAMLSRTWGFDIHSFNFSDRNLVNMKLNKDTKISRAKIRLIISPTNLNNSQKK